MVAAYLVAAVTIGAGVYVVDRILRAAAGWRVAFRALIDAADNVRTDP